jgi:NAD(P)-dependent dehydrogenase (short-subunit alcohol dehydrogenase family)
MALLSGKITIVLGASDERSMGAAAARKAQAEGATVIIASRNEEKVSALAKALHCEGVRCDITRDDDLAALAAFAQERHGRLDVALNFTGIEASAPITEMTREMLLQSADVHFAGTAMFIRFMANAMTDGGAIVTTSSQLAQLPAPGQAAYGGAKAAGDHVVRIAANELGARNIRVNSIAPGFTPSAMTEAYLAVPSIAAAFKREMALPRFGTVEDMANAACWLASEQCFATGVVLDLSAGQTLRRIPTYDEMMGQA